MFSTIFDEKEKLWTGLSRAPHYNINLSVGQAILQSLESNPNKIGQISDNNGMMLTNNEIRMKTIFVSQNLLKIGVKEGDVVAVIARNQHYVAPVVFACLTILAPVNTLDASFTPTEIAHIMKMTQPKIIFCDSNNVLSIRDSLKLLKTTVPIFAFGGKVDGARMVEELFVPCENDELFCPPNLTDGKNTVAAIVCSSGTTGLSKGVGLTHAAILENMLKLTPLIQDDVMLCFSSLYWLSGFLTLMLATIIGARRIITTETFNPELFLHIVEKYKVTVTMTSPSYIALLLQSDRLCQSSLSSMKLFWCGGSYVAEELTREMNKYLINGRVQVAYGLTEIAGLFSANNTNRNLNSVGKLVFNIKVKLIDDNGQWCGVNETGEICCMTLYPFLGYFGDEENTKQILDDNGWIHTGDAGYFDADGYLYIVDRKKDILKYMNYQISPSELESIILTCDGVANVCVVGIPDLVKTDLPAAVVVRTHFGHRITSDEIKNAVQEKCSDFKQLRGGVYFVETLPMTPSGKILRRIVRGMAIELYNNTNGIEQ
ncbi:4-coumarate--CoA ligase 1-like [Bradysia coprophila]|uniref:4-coumarate--CoA ligase 1-like n=1 Tax=Bradysia coprophila TaxID=38358 RepID=UPI00187D86FF|nr:4-coumarate--CoA ligase 1-like [Bradysia coprophila]